MSQFISCHYLGAIMLLIPLHIMLEVSHIINIISLADFQIRKDWNKEFGFWQRLSMKITPQSNHNALYPSRITEASANFVLDEKLYYTTLK